jgi:hypothetical protein
MGKRHDPAAFYPRERPGTDCTGGWVEQKWVPGIFPGGKGGRCVGLTSLPLSLADCLEIWSPNLLEPSGPVQVWPFSFQNSSRRPISVAIFVWRVNHVKHSVRSCPQNVCVFWVVGEGRRLPPGSPPPSLPVARWLRLVVHVFPARAEFIFFIHAYHTRMFFVYIKRKFVSGWLALNATYRWK